MPTQQQRMMDRYLYILRYAKCKVENIEPDSMLRNTSEIRHRQQSSTQLNERQRTQTPSLAPRASPSRLKPEMEQQKVVVFLRERKQGSRSTPRTRTSARHFTLHCTYFFGTQEYGVSTDAQSRLREQASPSPSLQHLCFIHTRHSQALHRSL